MSWHLGRLLLNEPNVWATTGDRTVVVTGNYKASSLADGLVKRDQLLGYANDFDEPVIPVTIDNEARVNGYYRVTSVAFTTDEFVRRQGNLYDYQVGLEAVSGFAQPQFESIVTGGLLVNAVGAVSGDVNAFHAVPNVATEYWMGAGGSIGTRSSADGTLLFRFGIVTTFSARFYLTPANYYIGAATIEQGSPLQPIIGRQLAQNDVANWRLSNGLVRVTPNASAGKIDVSHWKGATWSAVKTYVFSMPATFGTVNGFTTMTVLRNGVEECAIRLACTGSGGNNWGRANLDLRLRRGDRLLRCYATADQLSNWKVARDTAEAATPITYGAVTLGNLRATANDADGNRYVLISDQAPLVANDTTNGALTQPAGVQPGTMDVGIGSEIGGSGASAPDDAVSIAKQYLAAQGEHQQTAAR